MAFVAINHPLACQDLLPFHQISKHTGTMQVVNWVSNLM